MAGIYIHIPFCRQACHYCNFHFSTSLRKKDALVQAINEEIRLVVNEGPDDFKPKANIESVYFGGGTPSIMDEGDVKSILDTIYNNFIVDEAAEITLEANPDDITDKKLAEWRASGINRLSIGIQSFFNEDLLWMNRTHNAEQAQICLQNSLAYFENISIDLIYGIPGLTNERWESNVMKAIEMNVPHMSCYALTVEAKTPLYKLLRTGKKEPPEPGLQADQFLLLMDWMMAAGYEHYEISNFARPAYRSRHNTSYWQGTSYIGFGPSAHSYNGAKRRWNVANNQQYITAIHSGIIPAETEILTGHQKLNENIMVSLRTIEGIDLLGFQAEEKDILLEAAQKYIRLKFLKIDNEKLKLTRQGILFADGIAASLFFDEG